MTIAASLSPVLKYHGLAWHYLSPPRFLMRPQLNGGTLARARIVRWSRPSFRSRRNLISYSTTPLHLPDLRTQAKAFQTALEIGAASVDDVVTWASDIVSKTDHPHWSICELALCSGKYPPDLAEFLTEVPGSLDATQARTLVIRMLAASLNAHPDRANQIAHSLYDLASRGDLDDSPIHEVARWAWDALDLADAGLIAETRADVLVKMQTAFDEAVGPEG